jgi:hypothetical protein
MNPETKLWHEVKKNLAEISWTRLENSSVLGTPDLLGCNTSGVFFTVELKVSAVTSSNRIRFSPHQLSFHIKHPHRSFVLAKNAIQGTCHLFPGAKILELDACGLKLEPLVSGLEDCHEFFKTLE